MGTTIQLLSIILVFFIVLAAAYYFTKFVANRAVHSGNGSNLKMIEGIALNKDNSIYIVKVCSKYLVLSCTQNSVSTLLELDENEIKFEPYNNALDISFKKYFMAFINKNNKSFQKAELSEEELETLCDINLEEKKKNEDKYDFKSKLNKFTNENRDDI